MRSLENIQARDLVKLLGSVKAARPTVTLPAADISHGAGSDRVGLPGRVRDVVTRPEDGAHAVPVAQTGWGALPQRSVSQANGTLKYA